MCLCPKLASAADSSVWISGNQLGAGVCRGIGTPLADSIVVPPPRVSQNGASLSQMPMPEGRLMQKTLKVLNVFEDSSSGAQVFQIHEQDPDYKIDRIVYREKSPYG